MKTSANYLDSDGSSITTDLSDLQSVFHHLKGTPWSPAIVLTLDVSASMEYEVCISTQYMYIYVCVCVCLAVKNNNCNG